MMGCKHPERQLEIKVVKIYVLAPKKFLVNFMSCCCLLHPTHLTTVKELQVPQQKMFTISFAIPFILFSLDSDLQRQKKDYLKICSFSVFVFLLLHHWLGQPGMGTLTVSKDEEETSQGLASCIVHF